jgi:arsenite-transporting ATPase
VKTNKGGRRRKVSKAPSSSPLTGKGVSSKRYLFFAGKGGVGKTTAACATALYLLDQAKHDERILVFSTDPAHSLSDSLALDVGDRLVQVARHGSARLFAREMDAVRALQVFKDQHRSTLGLIAERGTFLDESDIDQLLNLSLPGVDEVMALFELSEFDRDRSYTRIIVDTAPSGHTSRLLRLPQVFTHMLKALDLMAEKHRYMVAHFARRGPAQDEVDRFLLDLSERIEQVREMLYDQQRTAFTLVTIPELMSVEETSRYLDLLRGEGVPVTDLIINRLEDKHDRCRYCYARMAGQRPYLKDIDRRFKALHRHSVPLMSEEVRGFEKLREFARLVWEGDKISDGDQAKLKKASDDARGQSIKNLAAGANRRAGFGIEAKPLLIFGGKGGVGKTTAAAAMALALAEHDRKARVLIFSTDPAHSLADSFGESIGELKQGVAGRKNLDAMEIDAGARFEELKARYREWTDQLFASLTAGSRWEVQFDREAMRELAALAPPGIDEIAALSVISDLLGENGYTSIVIDTAPTGHLLRFLELPEVALSWARTLLKLLLKYKEVVRLNVVAEELIELSKNIKRVMALLTNMKACEFVGVAIPEKMSLEETLRMYQSLEQLKIPLRRLLINNVVPAEAAAHCDFCNARYRQQQGVIVNFKKRLRRVAVFVAPQQPHEIRGAGKLREHFNHWQSAGENSRARSRARVGRPRMRRKDRQRRETENVGR